MPSRNSTLGVSTDFMRSKSITLIVVVAILCVPNDFHSFSPKMGEWFHVALSYSHNGEHIAQFLLFYHTTLFQIHILWTVDHGVAIFVNGERAAHQSTDFDFNLKTRLVIGRSSDLENEVNSTLYSSNTITLSLWAPNSFLPRKNLRTSSWLISMSRFWIDSVLHWGYRRCQSFRLCPDSRANRKGDLQNRWICVFPKNSFTIYSHQENEQSQKAGKSCPGGSGSSAVQRARYTVCMQVSFQSSK